MSYQDGEPKDLLEKARRCFRRAVDAEAKQREREREDLRFQVAEYQWTEKAKAERADRPTLSISKLDQPMQLVLNQARAAKLGVNIHPVSEEADDDTAEVLQGIYRRIERDSNASEARLWALQRAVVAGRGVYRVNVKHDEDSPIDGPEAFDQEIVIERILHQETVYFDPSATKPDCSDGEWAFVTVRMTRDQFRKAYPKAEVPTSDHFEGDDESFRQDWLDNDGGFVVVAEYWAKEHNEQTVCLLGDGTVVPKEQAKKGAEIIAERTRDDVKVWRHTLTGAEVLESVEWDGRYIPLIRVLGRELLPFDGERRFVGMIGPAKDAQRYSNTAISTFVEAMFIEPKAPFIGAEGQFDGHENKWNQANIVNWPYLEYKPVTHGGTLAPPPARNQVDTTRMQLAMMAIQEADKLIQSATYVHDPSLGRETSREKSGRAILALQQQGDAGTSHYLENLAQAMRYEAIVTLDLIPKKYDRRGRITRLLGGEDDVKTVVLNQPFVTDERGQPVPLEEGDPRLADAKVYDLTKGGAYSVVPSIGRSFQTRLEQAGTEIGELLQAAPELFPVVGDLYLKFRDFPGAKEMAERVQRWIEMQFKGLTAGKDGQPSPAQSAAAVQALEQQVQAATQQIQMMQQAIETDRAKQEAMIAKAQLDSQTKERIAESNNQTKVILERLEMLQKQMEIASKERIHREEMAHDVGMAAGQGQSYTMRREGGQESGQEREDERSSGGSSESTSESSTSPQADGSGE